MMMGLDRFCVGDRFYLADNRILCEYDYEERMMLASLSGHPAPGLAPIQRRVTDVQVRLLHISARLRCHPMMIVFDERQ